MSGRYDDLLRWWEAATVAATVVSGGLVAAAWWRDSYPLAVAAVISGVVALLVWSCWSWCGYLDWRAAKDRDGGAW